MAFEALGGVCELLAIAPTRSTLAEGARWIAAMHGRLTRFDDASELQRLNAAAGRWVDVSPELEALLREALRAYELSDGLVHVGVLRRMVAIGYARSFSTDGRPGGRALVATPTRLLSPGATLQLPASASALEPGPGRAASFSALRARGPLPLGPTTLTAPAPQPLAPLPELLAVAPGRARLAPGAGVDLGGIAKGWLADRLAAGLGENVVVNLAGDLFARGAGPDGEGWPVGVGGVTVLLRDAGAATSGTSVRRWGDGLHHLIDPRTGLPAESDLREVSVVASSATDAEIYAKAALLLGAARAADYLMPRALGWWLT